MLKTTAIISIVASLGLMLGANTQAANSPPQYGSVKEIYLLRRAGGEKTGLSKPYGLIPLNLHLPRQHPAIQTNTQFQFIAQPLEKKVAVTFLGIGLIGLELWWFLLSKPKSQKAFTSRGL